MLTLAYLQSGSSAAASPRDATGSKRLDVETRKGPPQEVMDEDEGVRSRKGDKLRYRSCGEKMLFRCGIECVDCKTVALASGGGGA